MISISEEIANYSKGAATFMNHYTSHSNNIKEGAMKVGANIAAFACIFIVGACGLQNSKQKPKTEPRPQTNEIKLTGMVASTESIQTELVNKYCISCHGKTEPANGLDLSDITASISLDDDIIIPNKPAGSEFYKEMASGDMPPEGDHISADSLAIVSAWIEGLPVEAKDESGTKPADKPIETKEQPTVVEPTLNGVQALVNRSCIKCHGEPKRENKEVDLTDISKLIMTSIGEPTSGVGGKIITPAKPLNSTFYTCMDPAFTQDSRKLMPKKADALSPEVLAAVRTWIQSLPELKTQNPCEVDPNGPDCEEPVPMLPAEEAPRSAPPVVRDPV